MTEKKLSIKEVEYIAELARIKITEEEKEKLSSELSDILVYIKQLHKVNTDGVEPVSQVTGMVNILREDIIENCDEDAKKIIIDNFPEEKDGYIKVRQVM